MGFTGGIWVLWNPINILVKPIGTVFHEIHFKVQGNFSIFILTALYVVQILMSGKLYRKQLLTLQIVLILLG